MRPVPSRPRPATILSRGAERRAVDHRRATERERARRTTVEMPPRGGWVRRRALKVLPWLVLVAALAALLLMAVAPSWFATVLAAASAVLAVACALLVVSAPPLE